MQFEKGRTEGFIGHDAVSGYDITEIIPTSDKEKVRLGLLNQDEMSLHHNNIPPLSLRALPASVTHMLGCCGSLAGFNKQGMAMLFLLQSALQTHLYLWKPYCLHVHMALIYWYILCEKHTFTHKIKRLMVHWLFDVGPQ